MVRVDWVIDGDSYTNHIILHYHALVGFVYMLLLAVCRALCPVLDTFGVLAQPSMSLRITPTHARFALIPFEFWISFSRYDTTRLDSSTKSRGSDTCRLLFSGIVRKLAPGSFTLPQLVISHLDRIRQNSMVEQIIF
jgi:hypothetical protein